MNLFASHVCIAVLLALHFLKHQLYAIEVCLLVSREELSANLDAYSERTFQVVGITETTVLLWINLRCTTHDLVFDEESKQYFESDILCEEFAHRSSPYVKKVVKDQNDVITQSKILQIDRHVLSQNIVYPIVSSISDTEYDNIVSLVTMLISSTSDSKKYHYVSHCKKVKDISEASKEGCTRECIFSVVYHSPRFHVWTLKSSKDDGNGSKTTILTNDDLCESLSFMSDKDLEELQKTYTIDIVGGIKHLSKCYCATVNDMLQQRKGHMEILASTENDLFKIMIFLASSSFGTSRKRFKILEIFRNQSVRLHSLPRKIMMETNPLKRGPIYQ